MERKYKILARKKNRKWILKWAIYLSDNLASVFLIESASVTDQLKQVEVTVRVLHHQAPASWYFEVSDVLRGEKC